MFQLHETTRRRFCLTGFVLFCLVPTVLTTVWCVWWRTPFYRQAAERELGLQFGLDVSLEDLRHLRPGVTVYEGLQLTDPETRQVVLRCRTLRAVETNSVDSQGQDRPKLSLIASGTRIEAARLDQVGEFLARLLRRPTKSVETQMHLTAAELTLEAGTFTMTLEEVNGKLVSYHGGAEAYVEFRPSDSSARAPVSIRLARNRQTVPASDSFELNTGGTELPCPLLASALPCLASLGSQSRFVGTISAHESAGEWSGGIAGQWLNVDLGRLISERFAHRFSGKGQVSVPYARFQQGRLEVVSGSLQAGPGSIGRPLLESLVTQLGLVRGFRPEPDVIDVPYRDLAVRFLIDSEGIRLSGQAGQGAILVGYETRLLGEPRVESVPTAALVRALVPAGEIQVPATQQSQWLLRRLPLAQDAVEGRLLATPPSIW